MNKDLPKDNKFNQIINNIFYKYKKFFLVIVLFSFLIVAGIFYYNHHLNNENLKISENYIKAGIYLSKNQKNESKTAYKEIILKKNKFYSLLSLSHIIDNNLEKDENEIIKLFQVVEKINLDNEQKNLIKLKKALYFLKISRVKEGSELLEEIISANSIWKEIALEISE
jgi:predicted negative regulator of RcsB-dependent stress response